MVKPEKWEKQIHGLMEKYGIAGLAAAVTDREKTIWHQGFGVTSIEKPWDPVRTDTLFRIASCTKLTVGILTMQMVEEGLLDLDTSILKYVPWFQMADNSIAEKITLRRLLSHSAGLPSEYTPDGPNDEDKMEAILKEGIAGLYPVCSPEDKLYYYSNWGIRLVSWILQDISGMPFTSLVKQRVLIPLGMEHSAFSLSEVATFSLAVPHRPGPRVLHFIPVNAARHAVGGMFSTADDLARLARVLLNEGRPLIKPESFRQLVTPECSLYLNYRNEYGLTMRLKQYKDVLICGHDGQSPPYYSSVWTVPEKGVGVTLLLNTEGGNLLSTDIIPKLILDDLLELSPDWNVWEQGSHCEEAEAAYAGDYLSDVYGLVRMKLRNGIPVLSLNGRDYTLIPHQRKGVYFFDSGGNERICVGLPETNGGSGKHILINGLLCCKIVPSVCGDGTELKQYEGEYGTVLDHFTFMAGNERLSVIKNDDREQKECRYIQPDIFSCAFGAVRFVRKGSQITGVLVGGSTCYNKK